MTKYILALVIVVITAMTAGCAGNTGVAYRPGYTTYTGYDGGSDPFYSVGYYPPGDEFDYGAYGPRYGEWGGMGGVHGGGRR